MSSKLLASVRNPPHLFLSIIGKHCWKLTSLSYSRVQSPSDSGADTPSVCKGASNKGPKDCNAPEACKPKDCDREIPKDVVKITICGSTGDVGRPLSLLLKKSQYVNELNLFDTSDDCCALGIELAYLNLKCKIKSFCSPKLLKKSLENSNIVVIVTNKNKSDNNASKVSNACAPSSGVGAGDAEFNANAKIVKDICESCLDACPKAIIAIVSDPVSSMVPLACEVMKKRGKFENIRRVMGVTALGCIRCESMVSSMLNIPMDKLTVPVVGGTSAETLVPILSHMCPKHAFTKDEFASLTEGLRAAVTEVEKAGGYPTITTAYAAATFIETLCRVIKGEQGVQQCAFVATPHWLALGYLACPVRLCRDGVEEVLYPPINDFEQCLLNKAEKQLKEEIKKGMDYIRCDTSGAEVVSTD